MLNHAKSDIYKAAMTRMQGDGVRLRGECNTKHTLDHLLSTLDQATCHQLKLRFDICYVMAKQNLPFSTYSALLELEAHHEAELYKTLDSAKA